MSKAAIMLGGNLPGSQNAMETAIKKFEANGFRVTAVSGIFHSAAVDCVPGTPDFIDQAITGEWEEPPEKLLELCQKIEIEAGRPAKHSSRESRILDCDIILFDKMEIDTPALTVPHPRAHQREFVLSPMAEIAGNWCFPDGTTVAAMLKRCISGR